MKRYEYVGPKELLALLGNPSSRARITGVSEVLFWLKQHPQRASEVTVTFIIDLQGRLWIADRHSEHVVCARGGPVLSAGEMTLSVERARVEVTEVSNQSTGFCPEPESWPSVAAALDAIGIVHPPSFTSNFDFRRCSHCGSINLVKDAWFFCGVCEAELNPDWNF